MGGWDGEVTEVVIVLEELDAAGMSRVVEELRVVGLEVWKVIDDESVIEGSIDAGKVRALEAVPTVRYVRSVLTYTVNYPPGDPRDRDGE